MTFDDGGVNQSHGRDGAGDGGFATVNDGPDLDSVHDVFGQGWELSAAMDAPLRKAQDALMVLTEIRGLLIGWREGIDGLNLE